jgi:ribokinase
MDRACAVLDDAVAGDWALLQNETNGADSFVAAARKQGLKLAYSAAPFDASVVLDLLPHTDLLVVNEGEAAALGGALGKPVESAGIPHLVITLGSAGATYHGVSGTLVQPAFSVDVVDTTGAGDCYLGYLLAGMAAGDDIADAMAAAAAAAALHVSRPGTGAAIPTRSEADRFLQQSV